MALGDKVAELQQTVAAHEERLDTVLGDISDLTRDTKEVASQLADLRRVHEREIALLNREIEQLKQWTDDRKRRDEEINRRLWSFGPNVVGAIVSGLIAAVVAYFIARR